MRRDSRLGAYFALNMGRVIGIDFGLKRTGLAVSDPIGIIASALDTVDSPRLMDFLRSYVQREPVDGFVVGLPSNLDGTPTDITPNVHLFVDALRKTFPALWVETLDERFTSKMAQHALLASGVNKKARRDKGALDRISATIILQDWLGRKA